MKKKLMLACAIVFFAVSEVFAYSEVYYVRKTVIQSVQACGPVTVNVAKIDSWGNIGQYAKYTVSSGTTWNQRMKISGGYDCHGTNIRVYLDKKTNREHFPNGVKYGNTVYYYVEYETYYYSLATGSGSYGGGNSGSSSSVASSAPARSSYSSSSSSDNTASELGAAMGHAAMETQRAERIYENYHAGGFSLAPTVSAAWGENLDLRFRYGSSRLGGDVTCMIGHDWIRNIPGILWNIGLGFYFGGRPSNLYLWDIDLGVKLGHCNNPDPKSFTAMIDLSTTHLFGPKHVIGLTAGVGIGLDGVKKAHFVWDARAGIVVYFLQWDWL